jgi:nitroreductase/Pyruvate/2-oxoacid:ferredoxin oxidoreductase delta subunit
MAAICIDKKKCKRDSLCIIECPLKIIQKDENGYPVFKGRGGTHCIDCGHCTAICPHDAITLNNHSPEEYEHIFSELKISEEAIEQLIKSRRSVRHYREQAVSKKEIRRLLDIVRWAPTASNGQPVNWLVIENRKITHKIAELVIDGMERSGAAFGLIETWKSGYDCILYGAPNLLIAYAPEKNFNPTVDCSIAMTTFELAASSMGIGACWAGIFMMAANTYTPLKEYLNIPEGHKVFSALMFGYPKFKYHRIPTRNKSKVSWMG